MIEYLSVDDVSTINADELGLESQVLDAAGLAAASARPYSGFGGQDLFETVYDKAGALLHGLCSTQYFRDGNKRTAWVAAKTFLAINGVRLREVASIQSEAFVLAVATIHDFGPDRASEWFRATQAGVMRPRLKIATVGDAVTMPNMTVDFPGFEFSTPLLAAGEEIDQMASHDGRAAGWTAVELHAIAHGVPCACPIGRDHEARGLLE